MKKSLFLAALAVVAMASCTKNELKVPSAGTEAEISFQPVVANATKASYITNESIGTAPASFDFTVYAWYTPGNMPDDATGATAYMTDVEVDYSSTIDDGTTEGSGAWAPSTKYYWPKNGKLSFDAYAPSAASADATKFESDKNTGIKITGYTVKALEAQYDLLFSSRTLDQVNSTSGINTTYDGVDIKFNHALSAIEVTAKTNADYPDAIRLDKITILNAYTKGDFSQGMSKANLKGTPKWDNQNSETDYVLFNGAQTLTETALTSTTTTAISNAILLPQDLAHTGGSTNHVSIKVEYSIKHGSSYLNQEQTFDLSTCTDTGSNTLTKWEIGKRYTYNFVFSLEDIYFAPSVENWTEVTVTILR